MAITWPTDLGMATIVGRLLWAEGDGTDPDRTPDVLPVAGGTVTVEASVSRVRYTGVDGPALLFKRATSGVIDADGYLCTKGEDGAAGVRGLIVPATDADVLSPTGFTYAVAIRTGGQSVTFSIAAPGGSTVDLATASPVDSSGGSAVIVDTSTADRAEAAADRAETVADGLDQAIADAVAGGDWQGEPGTDGASAYDIAVTGGFVGTEAAWIASLEGPKGDPGVDGADGAPGEPGAQGETGPQGEQGIPGVKGDTGDTGPAGADGANGATGPEGPQGPEGPRGPEGPQGPQGIPGTDGTDGIDGQNPVGAVIGDGVTNIVALTQAEYDALTPDAATLYLIREA